MFDNDDDYYSQADLGEFREPEREDEDDEPECWWCGQDGHTASTCRDVDTFRNPSLR